VHSLYRINKSEIPTWLDPEISSSIPIFFVYVSVSVFESTVE
jgi:hypothetical protein